MGKALMWDIYWSKCHTKGCWGFGFDVSPYSLSFSFGKWTLTFYDDEF